MGENSWSVAFGGHTNIVQAENKERMRMLKTTYDVCMGRTPKHSLGRKMQYSDIAQLGDRNTVLSVALVNQGDGAYKPEEHGKEFTLKKTLDRKEGSDGRVVCPYTYSIWPQTTGNQSSRSRIKLPNNGDEVKRLCESFGLDPDDALNVYDLEQELGESFRHDLHCRLLVFYKAQATAEARDHQKKLEGFLDSEKYFKPQFDACLAGAKEAQERFDKSIRFRDQSKLEQQLELMYRGATFRERKDKHSAQKKVSKDSCLNLSQALHSTNSCFSVA
jgi:hypothetical protein